MQGGISDTSCTNCRSPNPCLKLPCGMPRYAQPLRQFLETGREVEGKTHSAYHEHLFKLRKVCQRMFTVTARTIAEERLRYLDEFFERLIDEMNGKR